MAPPKPPKNLVDLKTVIKKVQEALDEYQGGLGGLPPLASAEFDFKTTTDIVIGFNVNFWIFKLGASRTKETVHQLTFTYEPPKPPKALKEAEDIKDALAKAIKAAAEAVQGSDTDKLKFKKLAITIQFGVKWVGNGGVSIPISLVTIGPTLEISKNSVHSVKIVFGKTAP
jgi:hypothetical protein